MFPTLVPNIDSVWNILFTQLVGDLPGFVRILSLSFARGQQYKALAKRSKLFSSFGQTFYIAQFSGEIREAFGLSDGEFGKIYADDDPFQPLQKQHFQAIYRAGFGLVW